LIVYRQDLHSKSKEVQREIIHGPLLYKPLSTSEWSHKFSWHGHDPTAGETARKRPHALKFEKLMLAPSSMYYDVENVRTADDALISVRLMIFFCVNEIEIMLDATNDPIADLINSVSSDVISFCSARSFEMFKEGADHLNMMGSYPGLTDAMKAKGISVSKIVFRGYLAPTRLQKMHDDAIEKRTRLILERESEIQEQTLKDERLEKEEEREKKSMLLATAKAEHRAALQRTQFVAEQQEARETAEQEHLLKVKREESELRALVNLETQLKLDSKDVASLLVARAHSAAKLIQVASDCKATVQIRE